MIRRLVHARSGNSMRAAIALEAAGLPFQRTEIDLQRGEQRSAQHLALNPAGKVPVYLEEGEGAPFVLTQSAAILGHVLGGTRPDLFPTDPRHRALANASVYAAVSDIAITNQLLRYMEFDPKNVAFLRDRLLNALSAALAPLADQPFVCGQSLTIADIAHYPVVHMRRAMLSRAEGFAHVLAWADRLRLLEPFDRAIAYSGIELPAEAVP